MHHQSLGICLQQQQRCTLHGFTPPSPAVAHPFHDTLSLPEADLPDLVGGESYEWAAIGDLDAFFKRIYRCAAQHGTAYVQHSAEAPFQCHATGSFLNRACCQ